MRATFSLACILLGAIGVLVGMDHVVTGTQHGEPATPAEAASYETATRIGVALVVLGVLLQVWPAVAKMRRSRSERRTKHVWVTASFYVLGLALVVTGAGYFADGVQEGAPGGRGAESSGDAEPGRDGGRGEAGSLLDMQLGSLLMVVGVVVQLGTTFLGRRHLPENTFQRAASVS